MKKKIAIILSVLVLLAAGCFKFAAWNHVNNFYGSYNSYKMAATPEQLARCDEMKEVIRPAVEKMMLDEGETIEASFIHFYQRAGNYGEYHYIVADAHGRQTTHFLRTDDSRLAILMAAYYHGWIDAFPEQIIVEPLPGIMDVDGYLYLTKTDPYAEKPASFYEWLLESDCFSEAAE